MDKSKLRILSLLEDFFAEFLGFKLIDPFDVVFFKLEVDFALIVLDSLILNPEEM